MIFRQKLLKQAFYTTTAMNEIAVNQNAFIPKKQKFANRTVIDHKNVLDSKEEMIFSKAMRARRNK